MAENHRYPFNRPWVSSVILYGLLLAGFLGGCSPADGRTEPTQPTASPVAVQLGPTSTMVSTPTPSAPTIPTPTLIPIPAIDSSDHSLGNPEAPITLLVYSDFQCPYCESFYQTWKQIHALHPEDVRLVFRHFPLLPIHDKADLAGAASEIAARDNRFWEMHDMLFERHEEWVDLDREAFIVWILSVAEELDLNPVGFLEELSAGETQADMIDAYQTGVGTGIPGTPFIFLNSEWYRLNPTVPNLEASIRLERLKSRQFADPPLTEFKEGMLYFAHLYLDQGEILIQLYPEQAPATVASFMFLAEQGWYDRIGFHTVQAGTLVESGDPSGTGLGGPGYLLFDELSDTLNFNEIGMLAMSSSGPDTNGSRFFINLVPLPHLNGSRTIFGRVLKGLDLLMQLDERDPYLDLFEPYMLVIDTIAIERR